MTVFKSAMGEEQLFFSGREEDDNAPGEIQGSREQSQPVCKAVDMTGTLRTLREAELDHLKHESFPLYNYLTFVLSLEQNENCL